MPAPKTERKEMNLRNIPKEYHEALYVLEAEQAKQGHEVRPKYDPEQGLTIVIYKRFLGIPIKIDIRVDIADILKNIGFVIKKVFGAGKNKIPVYVIEAGAVTASEETGEPEKPKKAKRDK